MRNVLFFMMVSLDGYFEGQKGDISWHQVDAEFNDFAVEQLNSVDTLLFGRVTYEGMASYWTTVSAGDAIGDKMNAMPKIVFSRTLDKVEWNNTRLIKTNIAEEVMRLKHQPGKALIIFGSSKLATAFAEMGLIDEYRIMVSPIVLGEGNPLFKGIKHPLKLELTKSRTFSNGNIVHYYRPQNNNL